MEFITVDIADGIADVTFCRQPVNALVPAVFAEIAATFESFADDRNIRAAVFRTCGDKAFIAGADLKAIDNDTGSEPSPSSLVDRGALSRSAFAAIHECAVPVVAAVDGPAIGGGLTFVAVCDIIVASERATFGATEINVGLLGASAHLVRMVGPYKAREMYLTGALIDAHEMATYGCIAAVVPPEQLLDTARSYAATLASKSPLALRMAKQAMNRTEDLPFDEGYRIEQDYTARLLRLEDSAEARRAYAEKRDPQWKWR
jgi:enoyl-CoA hydratase